MVANNVIQEDLRRKFNRVDSNHGDSISNEKWDNYFNEAYRAWFKDRVSIAKTNNKVRYDLRKLMVIDQKLEIGKKDTGYVVFNLPDNYYDIHRIVPLASKKGCKDHRELVTSIIQTNDWSMAIRDPYWKPSFLWARTLADENGMGMRVALGDFDIINVKIDYYRKPSIILSVEESDCEYLGALGALGKTNRPFELDEMQCDEITDIAVFFACRDVGAFQEAQTQYEKLFNTYKKQ